MKILSALLIIFASNCALAEMTEYKAWNKFQSNYGYDFKFPECWEIRINSPDESGDLKKVKDIFVTEKKSCTTSRGEEYTPNGISFSYSNVIKGERAKTEISIEEKSAKFQLQNKSWLLFKKLKIDGRDEAFMYVEMHDKWKRKIRWVMKLFCSTGMIHISGINTEKPGKELLDKFERGDFAMPEPEKTIFESIRCAPPKSKSK